MKNFMTISGQKPVITRAKKSIAAFKLREGMPIGCMVTLRKNRMYDFVNKLVNIALPRVRDFRGMSGKPWTAMATIPWGSRNKLFSLKSITIKSTESRA